MLSCKHTGGRNRYWSIKKTNVNDRMTESVEQQREQKRKHSRQIHRMHIKHVHVKDGNNNLFQIFPKIFFFQDFLGTIQTTNMNVYIQQKLEIGADFLFLIHLATLMQVIFLFLQRTRQVSLVFTSNYIARS